MSPAPDPYGLARFVDAQRDDYARVLAELRAGRKRTHWMWYVFPQIAGLGHSAMAQRYAIGSLPEARAYLDHPILGSRLRECAHTLRDIEGRTAHDIFGAPDDRKLHSCLTLFALVATDAVFGELVQQYFGGRPDPATLERVQP